MVSGFFTSWVYVVRSTGSGVTSIPRFVFHCCWAHSIRVLLRAEDEYVNLMPVSSGLPTKVELARAAFAAVTSNFWVWSSLS